MHKTYVEIIRIRNVKHMFYVTSNKKDYFRKNMLMNVFTIVIPL